MAGEDGICHGTLRDVHHFHNYMDKQQLGHRCPTNQDVQRDINRLPTDSSGLCRHRVYWYWSDKELGQ